MDSTYHGGSRRLQDRFDTRRLADRLDEKFVQRPFIDARDRVKYLYAAVPFITVLGSYLGWTYHDAGYELSTPVAIHFWYDFLVEAVDFLADPKNSPLSMRLGFAF